MSDKRPFLLTTTDNPFNPFTHFVEWYLQDLRLGHDTCGLIARFTAGADEADDGATIDAMALVVEHNFSGLHIMVTPEDYDNETNTLSTS